MAAQATPNAPSRRFIRVYLLTWGLLAAGGLAYLASLAWHPELLGPSRQISVPDQSIEAANRALAEVGSVRRTVTEIQRDIGRIKETIDQREAQERAAQLRLSALEERVSTLASPPPAAEAAAPAAAAPAAPAKQRPAKAKAAEPRQPTRFISIADAVKDHAPAGNGETAPAGAAPPRPETVPPVETGSLASAGAPVITFGEVKVTPAAAPARAAPAAYAVQLGAGPSLDALRLSWSSLVEKHGEALGSLEPRYVAPRHEGGAYRLVAGPLASKAAADKLCADMGVGRQGCFSTTFIGEPL